MVVTVITGVAVVSLWRGWAARQARPGETLQLGGGLVTFQMPQGWQQRACGASGCVTMRTPQGTEDVIRVIFISPFASRFLIPSEGQVAAVMKDPATLPGARSFTVDGAKFVRVRFDAQAEPDARPGMTSVTGYLRDGGYVFISCYEKAEPELVRAGCEVVIGTLHVRQ